jgi:hypothetical protein
MLRPVEFEQEAWRPGALGMESQSLRNSHDLA